jgi:hypothetical protein
MNEVFYRDQRDQSFTFMRTQFRFTTVACLGVRALSGESC